MNFCSLNDQFIKSFLKTFRHNLTHKPNIGKEQITHRISKNDASTFWVLSALPAYSLKEKRKLVYLERVLSF